MLTFKGAVQPGVMKVREEFETTVSDPESLGRLLAGLGFTVWFRYEKYREEFAAPGVTVAVDETPIGTFVEVEGDEPGILRMVAALGRSEADFVRGSYRSLFAAVRGAGNDMVFSAS